ncbi:MAG: class I SAM-dependent methyltransferase, partial [Chloroflexota bacterium]
MMMSEDDFCELIVSWLPPDGRVLDVGCGRGDMLLALEQRGIPGMGIDPYADEDGRRRRLRAEEMGQLGRSFDLVYT